MAFLVLLKTQKSEVTKYIDEKAMIRNDDWIPRGQLYPSGWQTHKITSNSSLLGTSFYYKNPSLWYHKIAMILRYRKSNLWYHIVDFVISKNQNDCLISQNQTRYCWVFSWAVIINAKSNLWYQKSILCHHQSIMISKYHNDFAISQIVFCGIENRCRDITELNWRYQKLWKNWGYYNILIVISQNRFCDIPKSIFWQE